MIEDRKNVKIGVIGLGYVGLPLAMAFDSAGYTVTGYDIDKQLIDSLSRGDDPNNQIDESDLESCNILFIEKPGRLLDCNTYIITVPTPINPDHTPDLRPLISASQLVSLYLKKGDTVIYESTVYPGTTEEICLPILEEVSVLTHSNGDFTIAYSPERINPSDKNNTLQSINKLVAASPLTHLDFVYTLYSSIIDAQVVPVTSIKVAEAAKALENTQRDVNIALMNEMAMICDRTGIDVNEVIDAACTKWNFNRYTPGLVGGHCIGVDPYYLSSRASALGHDSRLINSARAINESMVEYLINKITKTIAAKKVVVNNVIVWGVTFKPNCSDMRNSKVLELISRLKKELNCVVHVHDPMLDLSDLTRYGLECYRDDTTYDMSILAVAHDSLKDDYRQSLYKKDRVPIIVDINSTFGYADVSL